MDKIHFNQEDIQVAKNHSKRQTTSSATKERRIQTTVRYCHTPIRIATILFWNNDTVNPGENVEHWECSHVARENVKEPPPKNNLAIL